MSLYDHFIPELLKYVNWVSTKNESSSNSGIFTDNVKNLYQRGEIDQLKNDKVNQTGDEIFRLF